MNKNKEKINSKIGGIDLSKSIPPEEKWLGGIQSQIKDMSQKIEKRSDVFEGQNDEMIKLLQSIDSKMDDLVNKDVGCDESGKEPNRHDYLVHKYDSKM